LVGGVGGSVIGCLGGLIGTLASLGRARRLAIGLNGLIVVIGVGSLIAGVVALATGQPYAVHYPLLLGGLLCTILPLGLTKTLCRRYEEAELRKMNALDAR
jgi:MFS family permease